MKKISLLSAALLSTLVSTVSSAQVVQVPESEAKVALNQKIRGILNIPMYYNFPYDTHLPLKNSNVSNTGPVYVLNYKEGRESRGEALGLRLLVVQGKEDRLRNSQKLAESGIFENGDVVLSFRPEWFGSLKYSHVQLGVSHAGLLYIEEDQKTGKKYLKNLDMPMDEVHVGQGYLNSEHYLGAPFVHVVRPRGLTAEQKKNLGAWIRLMASAGPKAYAQNKIRFNQDYSDPKIKNDPDLAFVGDLGRIALGLPNQKYQKLTNYCSEFVWSLLALRDCDPATAKNNFQSQLTPSCVKPFFNAMPVLGNVLLSDNPENENLTVGMIDGVPLVIEWLKKLTRFQTATNESLDELIKISVFDRATGAPEKISSGHKAVEEAIVSANPQFYAGLLQYYQLINDENAATNTMIPAMAQQFNASQALNYSPTSYKVHALLPSQYKAKKFDYVGTIHYSQPVANRAGQKTDLYDVLGRMVKPSR